jgi:hypothetical protein
MLEFMELLSAVVAIGYYGEVGLLSPSCRLYESEAADFI